MGALLTFDELLDAVESLPLDAQEDLVTVLRKRLAERGRQRILEDVRASEAEFNSGTLSPISVDDLVREITSASH